jgi:hypothetical protein
MDKYLEIFYPADGDVIPATSQNGRGPLTASFVAAGSSHRTGQVAGCLIHKEAAQSKKGKDDPPIQGVILQPGPAWILFFSKVPPGSYVLVVHEVGTCGTVSVSEHVAIVAATKAQGLTVTWPPSNAAVSSQHFAPYGSLSGNHLPQGLVKVGDAAPVERQALDNDVLKKNHCWVISFPQLPQGENGSLEMFLSPGDPVGRTGLTVG